MSECILNVGGKISRFDDMTSALVALRLSPNLSGVYCSNIDSGNPNSFIKRKDKIRILGVAGDEHVDLNLYLFDCSFKASWELPDMSNDIITISGQFVYDRIQDALMTISNAAIKLEEQS